MSKKTTGLDLLLANIPSLIFAGFSVFLVIMSNKYWFWFLIFSFLFHVNPDGEDKEDYEKNKQTN